MEIELSRLIDALPGLVWTAFPDGRADFINQRWCEYAGFGPDQAIGLGWRSAIHPEDRDRLLEHWRASLESGQSGEVEARLRRHDGEYRWFLFSAAPLADPSGRVVKGCGVATDIEDRVRAEEAVRAREAQFRSIFDGLPVLVTLMTPDGGLDLANRHFLEFFGASLEAWKEGWPNDTSFHPDDFPVVLEAWRRSAGTGEPYDLEARRRRADGVYRWMRLRGFPLRGLQDQIVSWYSLQTDIDDAKVAEAKLAAEKRLLELVALDVPLPNVLEELCRQVEDLAPGCYCSILLLDPGGATFQIGAAPSLAGGYAAILDGKAIDPDYGPSALSVALKASVIAADLANDPRWTSSALPALLAEQGLRSCWATPVMSGGQEVLGVFAVYRRQPESPTANEQEVIDRFTHIAGIAIERAQADAALQAREAELRRAYEFLTEAQRLSHTGSFTWDVQADEHNWSEEIRRIFGFDSRTKVTMAMIQAAIYPEDMPAVEAVIGRAVEGANFDLVFRILGSGGAHRYAHVVAHRIAQITNRPVFIGALQDVTENKVAEEALNRARDDLAHVARVTALSALTASIAHEVNQPLAGIITNASTCLRMLAADPPNLDGARATAQRTIRDGNRASEVIQRLRALFARKSPATEPVDMNDAAGEVLALSSSELQRRHVVVRTHFTDGLPVVSGDRVQLQQVILNLIMNAADAMGGVDDRARQLLVATFRDETGHVALSVRDTGVGIEPENLQRLFDTFYTTKTAGMGIGLSVSRSIIENHDGRIWANANDGPGATFSFSLPCGSAPAPDGETPGARTTDAAAKHMLRKA